MLKSAVVAFGQIDHGGHYDGRNYDAEKETRPTSMDPQARYPQVCATELTKENRILRDSELQSTIGTMRTCKSKNLRSISLEALVLPFASNIIMSVADSREVCLVGSLC